MLNVCHFLNDACEFGNCLFWKWRLLYALRVRHSLKGLELGLLGAGVAGTGWGAAKVPVPEGRAGTCHSEVGVMMESPSQESL